MTRFYVVIFLLLSGAATALVVILQPGEAPAGSLAGTTRSVGGRQELEPVEVPRAGKLPEAGTAPISTKKFVKLHQSPIPVGRLELRLVAKQSGKALAGVLVTFEDVSARQKAIQKRLAAGTTPASPPRERFLRRFTSDAHGVVLLPEFENRALVEARLGPLWGRLYLNGPPRERLLLELNTDRELAVLVVDNARHPVPQVPVLLVRPRTRGKGYSIGTWATTGPDGVAHLLHVQRFLEDGQPWEVTFGFPLAHPPTIPAFGKHVPGKLPRLILPKTGSLKVSCVDVRGNPVPAGKAALRLTAHAGPLELSPPLWSSALWQYLQRNAKGEAVLPFVGLGLQFRATLMPLKRSSGIQPASVVGLGPCRKGQAVMLQVVLGKERLPVVVGRFVRGNRQPLAACSLAAADVITPQGSKNLPWQKVAVDDKGRFRLLVRGTCPPGGRYLCKLQKLAADGSFLHAPLKILMDLAPYTAPEDHEIGDVLFDYGPLLASGHVVDQQGNPVTDATIHVQTKSASMNFNGLPGFAVLTDKAGGFHLHWQGGSTLPKEELQLFAMHPMSIKFPKKYSFSIGTSGMTVVIPLGGGLEGSLKLEPGQKLPPLSASVQSPDNRMLAVLVEDHGKIRVTHIAPGLASLIISIGGSTPAPPESVLVRVDDIEIFPGKMSHDPRLKHMALPERFQFWNLTVQDQHGTPLRDVVVFAPRPGRFILLGRTDEQGVISIDWGLEGQELIFRAEGHRARRVRLVADGQVVKLKGGLPIQLEIAGLPSDHSLSGRLALSFVAADLEHGVGRRIGPAGTKPQAVSGKIQYDMPATGRFRIEWWVDYVMAGGGGVITVVPVSQPQTILIEDVGTRQAFRVSVPPVVLRRVLGKEKR